MRNSIVFTNNSSCLPLSHAVCVDSSLKFIPQLCLLISSPNTTPKAPRCVWLTKENSRKTQFSTPIACTPPSGERTIIPFMVSFESFHFVFQDDEKVWIIMLCLSIEEGRVWKWKRCYDIIVICYRRRTLTFKKDNECCDDSLNDSEYYEDDLEK
jgi:hypothetical protein